VNRKVTVPSGNPWDPSIRTPSPDPATTGRCADRQQLVSRPLPSIAYSPGERDLLAR
jgi:hypothetical protein